MKVEIKPNEGINDIKFGITQNQLEQIMGKPPKAEIDNIMEEVREMRQGMIFRFVPDTLKDIVISKHVDAWVHGIDIFNTANLINLLSAYDEPTKETDGYVNFYGLGLSVGGFGKKKIPEGKLVTVFAPDRKQYYEYFLLA
jgi:hypothetical protein